MAMSDRQWHFTVKTFGARGLGLPDAVATLVANYIAAQPPTAGQVREDQTNHVLQEVQHNEPAAHIDEEVAHTVLQLAADEAFYWRRIRRVKKVVDFLFRGVVFGCISRCISGCFFLFFS